MVSWRKFLTDQGKAFVSRTWGQMITQFQIIQFFSAVEHHQSNGLVEKANGTLVDRLAAFIYPDSSEWDLWLSAAVFAINSSVQESTNCSPLQIVHGTLPRLPIEARFPFMDESIVQESREETRRNLRNAVGAKIISSHIRQKKWYDIRRSPTQVFKKGDFVLVRRVATKKGAPRKLQPRFIGPFKILRTLSATTYEVGDLACNRTATQVRVFSAHSSQLKRWRLPPTAGDDVEEGDDENREDEDVDAEQEDDVDEQRDQDGNAGQEEEDVNEGRRVNQQKESSRRGAGDRRSEGANDNGGEERMTEGENDQEAEEERRPEEAEELRIGGRRSARERRPPSYLNDYVL